MAVTPDQLAAVRASLGDIHKHFDTYSTEFYENLFRRAPEMRAMFRDDLAGQGMKFLTTLDVVVRKLDDPEQLADQYKGLGALHKSLGVHHAHFAPMEEALMDTLRSALGDRFDAPLEAAWRAAYQDVAAHMVARGNIPD